ncbi:hypothetical protein PgNI_10731 [Pyricularia grisea]|uniref:Uncharacterized protein n=1 Tax=Pyricularia grisea TaxID=148305 RepID=A0A6P8AYM7_PYRGI|nr:hypothetical protein PgNI_10731 [Pyricularia grisea]TLD07447.1 hypothetical protein PgNI_10731 [Pyricularia grisea]
MTWNEYRFHRFTKSCGTSRREALESWGQMGTADLPLSTHQRQPEASGLPLSDRPGPDGRLYL